MTKFNQTYPTDLKYTEWQLISDFFPAHRVGRPRKWEMWQILNAILYVVRTGCQWRMLPNGSAAVANSLWLLSALEETRSLGADQCSAGENCASEK